MSKFAKVLAGEILDWRDDPVLTDQSTLAPSKPKWLPVIVEEPPFDPAIQFLEGPVNDVQADRVVQRYTVRDRELATLQADQLAAIRAEAQARISAVVAGSRDVPLERVVVKEINALARASALNSKGRSSWTKAEAAEAQQLENVWAAIASLRAKSNVKEAELLALTDLSAVVAYDPLAGWE